MKLVPRRNLLALFIILVAACAPARQTIDQSTPALSLKQPVTITFEVADQRSSVASRSLENNYAGKVTGVAFGSDFPTPDGRPAADYVKDMLERAANKANAQLGAGDGVIGEKNVALTLNYFEWSSRPQGNAALLTMRYDVQITVAEANGNIINSKQFRDEFSMTLPSNTPALWLSDYVYPAALQRIMTDESIILSLAQ